MTPLVSKFLSDPISLDKAQLAELIESISDEDLAVLIKTADSIRETIFEKKVFMRALIEISSFCHANCHYCGLRASNSNAERYRLTQEQILDCCEAAYSMGYRSYVLQGGEDYGRSVEDMCRIIYLINQKYQDCSITLSIGEKPKDEYQAYFDAGAHRYLLRHEAASRRLYEHIHPETMSYDNRRKCLQDLKDVGFQVGAGFMVGLPTQTPEDLAEDIIFVREFNPHMVGIGPFLPHKDTPLAKESGGTVRQTLLMLSIARITLPKALIPSTTALGTLNSMGREKGFIAGGNVVMPNVSPTDVRKKYMLYDNKIGTADTAVDSHRLTRDRIIAFGFLPDFTRGDHPDFKHQFEVGNDNR
ncbi:MAG: [FeFe] hydrogenase H-cluster radical SAM maturase HydE [Brevinema sp.]